MLDTNDDSLLMKRVSEGLTEQQAFGTHYNAVDMARRLKAYRKANNSTIAEPALAAFFQEQGIELHWERDCTKTLTAQALRSFKIYIERFERPFNYMTFDEEEEQRHLTQERAVHNQRIAESRMASEREEIVEREVRRQKEAYTKQRLEQIKEFERDILDQKS